MTDGWSVDQVKAQIRDFNGLADYLNRIADALGCDNPQIIERITELREKLEAVTERDEARAEVERLRAVLSEYVTGCHACLGVGFVPSADHDCPECKPARSALNKRT